MYNSYVVNMYIVILINIHIDLVCFDNTYKFYFYLIIYCLINFIGIFVYQISQ